MLGLAYRVALHVTFKHYRVLTPSFRVPNGGPSYETSLCDDCFRPRDAPSGIYQSDIFGEGNFYHFSRNDSLMLDQVRDLN